MAIVTESASSTMSEAGGEEFDSYTPQMPTGRKGGLLRTPSGTTLLQDVIIARI